jgi:myo-inositol-1(or 4)-monophosphatase
MQKKFFIKIKDRLIEITDEVACAIRNAPYETIEKGDVKNIVTTNDIKSQHMLVERLSDLIPGSKFFCEEEGLQATEGEYIWVIDPIDGTTNYSRGIKDSAISVALLYQGEVVLGVVRSIFTSECFSAVKGDGAYLDGRPIKVSDRDFASGILCTAMSLYKKEHAKVRSDIIFETYMQSNDVRRFGSCAMELCYLAEGICDLFFEFRVFPWDYAGALVILKEAGGFISGHGGEELRFDKASMVIAANSRGNFEELEEIVRRNIEEVPYNEVFR